MTSNPDPGETESKLLIISAIAQVVQRIIGANTYVGYVQSTSEY
jgi:hypothetical protein